MAEFKSTTTEKNKNKNKGPSNAIYGFTAAFPPEATFMDRK